MMIFIKYVRHLKCVCDATWPCRKRSSSGIVLVCQMRHEEAI